MSTAERRPASRRSYAHVIQARLKLHGSARRECRGFGAMQGDLDCAGGRKFLKMWDSASPFKEYQGNFVKPKIIILRAMGEDGKIERTVALAVNDRERS